MAWPQPRERVAPAVARLRRQRLDRQARGRGRIVEVYVNIAVQDWSASDISEQLAAGMPLEHPLRDDLYVLTMHYSRVPGAGARAGEHLGPSAIGQHG